MAITESKRNSEPRNLLSRRDALQGTAAATALVLPAGAAMAATGPAADPGLAELEAGYVEWQDMLSRYEALERLEEEYRGRAWDRVTTPELPKPEPPSPEVAKLWRGPSGLIEEARDPDSYVVIPQDILDQYDAFLAEQSRWWDSKPKIAAGDPDHRKAMRIEREREALWKKADRLRRRLLKIPTTTPRGLLLKLALATDTTRLQDFDKRFRRPRYYGTFDILGDLMPPLLADLRAMAAGGVA